MQKTYWIRYTTVGGVKFDKVTHRSDETILRRHKVEALDAWRQAHQGYGWHMSVQNVYTKDEMKANGYM